MNWNLFKRKPKESPKIETKWGSVSEAGRKRCALNMRENPVLRMKIEEALAQKEGSMEAGVVESKRRYPEAYLVVLLALLFAPLARADSINDVAQELRADSVLTFRSGVAKDLASNILVAQAEADYGGPVSLELSIEAVLRAIVIEQIYGNAKYVGFFDYTPLPWLQSEVATNPDATATLTPSSLNFGEVQVVSTPEPSTLLLLLLGLLLLAVLA